MKHSEDKNKIIEELEGLAKEVLKLKNESVAARRPIVIEFCGSPKAGKSSCISSLELFLRRNGFRTRLLTERASVCPIVDKYNPLFNIWTVSSALAELVEILSHHPPLYDVVIMDRGIFDGLCWFQFLRDKEKLDDENHASLEAFLLMNKLKAVIDLIYIFTVSPEVSLEREYANLLTTKTGSIMKPSILSDFKESILKTTDKYKSVYQRIEIYDTSIKNQNTVSYEVTKNILEILRENIEEKVGYFDVTHMNRDLGESFYFEQANIADIELKYKPRHLVETNNNYIQPLPILVIRDSKRKRVLVVRKNKRNTSATSPELGKNLIYLGGHIRREDMYHSTKKDLLSIAKYTLSREISEEIGVSFHPSKTILNPLCIWMRDNDRSAKHLAICFVLDTDFDTLRIKLDKSEFITSGNTKSGKVLPIEDLLKDKDNLESWSKLLLDEYFDYELHESQIQLV